MYALQARHVCLGGIFLGVAPYKAASKKRATRERATLWCLVLNFIIKKGRSASLALASLFFAMAYK